MLRLSVDHLAVCSRFVFWFQLSSPGGLLRLEGGESLWLPARSAREAISAASGRSH
jgi:hypothetical protein